MEIYLKQITGIDDAIVSMFVSKGNWDRELEQEIMNLCNRVLTRDGRIKKDAVSEDLEKFNGYISKLVKFGWEHITLLRFIDFSFSVDGLHRAGQDDWDSHAKRFDNRIIRLSTREHCMKTEMSDYYKGKVFTTDSMLEILGIRVPGEVNYNGKNYIKCQNGYVLDEEKNNPNTLRGLYPLGLSSTFVFKINLTEWAHVYKERNKYGNAHPEVKELCEECASQIEDSIPYFNRDLFIRIKN